MPSVRFYLPILQSQGCPLAMALPLVSPPPPPPPRSLSSRIEVIFRFSVMVWVWLLTPFHPSLDLNSHFAHGLDETVQLPQGTMTSSTASHMASLNSSPHLVFRVSFSRLEKSPLSLHSCSAVLVGVITLFRLFLAFFGFPFHGLVFWDSPWACLLFPPLLLRRLSLRQQGLMFHHLHSLAVREHH